MKDRLMKNEFTDVTRYVLEQEFAVAADKFEKHRTAIISIIGDAPLDRFERALKSLDYNSKRFRTFGSPSVGRWLTRPVRKVPEFVEGLILFSEQSSGALVTFEGEVKRYLDAGITPLIAWPGKRRFANQIHQLLAPHNTSWSFVRLHKFLSAQMDDGTNKFVDMAIATMEAMLLPGVYPGLNCLDTADMRTIYLDTHLRVVSICADRIEDLLSMLEAELDGKGKATSILAALYGPKTLKLSEYSAVMHAVRRFIDVEETTFLGAAISDARRHQYTLYVSTND